MRPPGEGKKQAKLHGAGLQYAALPYRLRDDGVDILLVTSRETRRWTLPKGWPMKSRTPSVAAAREAFEEAGVLGRIAAAPIGAYPYLKRLRGGLDLPCTVEVFPLQVTHQRDRWPEAAQRSREWFSREEAATLVQEPELQLLLAAFEPPRR